MNFLHWTAEDWEQGAGARLVGHPQGLKEVKGFSNDSRTVAENHVFVALKGENADGHSYVRSCLEKGAAGAVVSEAWWDGAASREFDLQDFPQACLLVVRDPLLALVDLAAYRIRKDLGGVLRIGITGSNGKTTTKEIVRSLFEAAGRKVFATLGNLNSEIGLPLMVLATPGDTEVAVYELGMNRPGEMDLLVRASHPAIGVVTNVGRAHIGILGSQDAIAFEKKKVLYRADRAVVWGQDAYRDFLLGGFFGKIELFGSYLLESWENLGLEGCRFTLNGTAFVFPLPGRHNLENALAALAVGRLAGLDEASLVRGLAAVKPVFGRSEILRGDITVLQDCYNANLDSMKGLLEFFADIQWESGRKYLVLGSMKELGQESEAHHRTLGLLAAGSGAEGIWFFGAETAVSREACEAAGTRAFWTDSHQTLAEDLRGTLNPGDLLAVKGSRGVKLETVVDMVVGKKYETNQSDNHKKNQKSGGDE